MVKKRIKNVNNLCKKVLKSSCNIKAKLSVKKISSKYLVQNYSFLQTFSTFSTPFPTISRPLFSTLFFHYSTDPTTNTTINNLIERRKKNEN